MIDGVTVNTRTFVCGLNHLTTDPAPERQHERHSYGAARGSKAFPKGINMAKSKRKCGNMRCPAYGKPTSFARLPECHRATVRSIYRPRRTD